MSTLEGLSHLAEAATALANLTCCASLSASAQIHISQAQRLQSLNVTKPSARRRVVKDAEGDAKNYPFATAFAAGNVKEIFPERLMAMMNNKSLADIITWLPHGRSFQILRPDVFSEFVLPKYLPPVDSRSSTKYPSFTRKMNRW